MYLIYHAIYASGAVFQGAISKETDKPKIVQDFVLWDVVPQSLGIELNSGIMDVMVKRNTAITNEIPKIYAIFTTPKDYITSLTFKIYQGEHGHEKPLFGRIQIGLS